MGPRRGRCAGGTLVPEDIRRLPAQTSGRVELVLRSGAQVTPDSVILELSNPELTQTVHARPSSPYQSAQAAFENRKAELQSGLLSQEADTANIEAPYKQAH